MTREGSGLPRPLPVIPEIFPSGNLTLTFFLHLKILASVRKSYHSTKTRLVESRIGKEFGRSFNLRTNVSCLVTYREMSPFKTV